MGWIKTSAVLAIAGVTAGSAGAQQKQVITGPVATYWMSAATNSGFGAGMMGAAQGGRPSMGAMMNAMRGGSISRTLSLDLGSSRRATGEPSAEHLPPPGLKAGASLPLLTPRAAPPVEDETDEVVELPREFEKPRGKMLIFWGCGEKARPGQPMVIDFAKAAEGKLPPGYEAAMRGFNLARQQPPAPGRNTTYGHWPNERTRTQVPGDGSLIGQHVIRGNYSPEIKFGLATHQDFLAPLVLTRNEVGPTGSAQLAWNLVPNAQAYLATAIGGGEKDTLVLWTSSEVQASAFALPDYLANADIARLTASKALMGPQTSNCTIPQEVVKAAPQAMFQLAAYGNETNLSYPPRPQDPKVPWNIEWTVKVRYKSQTGGLLGMDMADMGGPQAPGRGPAPGVGVPGLPGIPGVPGVGGAILRGIGKGKIPGL